MMKKPEQDNLVRRVLGVVGSIRRALNRLATPLDILPRTAHGVTAGEKRQREQRDKNKGESTMFHEGASLRDNPDDQSLDE